MKKFEKLGEILSKNEMKAITGGSGFCNTSSDCQLACVNFPNEVSGYYCKAHVCTFIQFCP